MDRRAQADQLLSYLLPLLRDEEGDIGCPARLLHPHGEELFCTRGPHEAGIHVACGPRGEVYAAWADPLVTGPDVIKESARLRVIINRVRAFVKPLCMHDGWRRKILALLDGETDEPQAQTGRSTPSYACSDGVPGCLGDEPGKRHVGAGHRAEY